MILIPIPANRKGILYTLLKSEVAWKEAPKIERQHRDSEKYFEQGLAETALTPALWFDVWLAVARFRLIVMWGPFSFLALCSSQALFLALQMRS